MNMRMRLRLRLRVWVWLWVREPIKCGTNMHTETQAETRVWHLVNSLAVCLGQLCMQFGVHPQSQRAAAATIVGKVTPKSHGKMQQKFSGKTKMRKKKPTLSQRPRKFIRHKWVHFSSVQIRIQVRIRVRLGLGTGHALPVFPGSFHLAQLIGCLSSHTAL